MDGIRIIGKNMKYLLMLNPHDWYCGDRCCSDHWLEPELWSTQENGCANELLFNSTRWNDISVLETDTEYILECFNKYHDIDVVLTIDNCTVA